jgi:hypothetical protein
MKPPKFYELDKQVQNLFTYNNTIPVKDFYLDDSEPNKQNDQYTIDKFEQYKQLAKNNYCLYYVETDIWLRQAFQDYPLKDKNVLIVGSTCPWYEAMALEAGCKTVTVVEYRPQIASFENVLYVTPDNLSDQQFDIILSISSYEHDGLGRYGDPINPDGDLIAMYNIRKYLVEDGLLFLVVPVGLDTLVWNAHRVYGKYRLPRLLSGWNVVETYGLTKELLNTEVDGLRNQPVFIFKQSKSIGSCSSKTSNNRAIRYSSDFSSI